jgi:hypothetical protein
MKQTSNSPTLLFMKQEPCSPSLIMNPSSPLNLPYLLTYFSLISSLSTGAPGGLGVLCVPHQVPFSTNVNQCERFEFKPSECPRDKLVDLEDVIQEARDLVMAELPKETGESGGYRVPPLVISRLARGGKSTFLCLLFDALKGCTTATGEKVSVMIVSFNGSTTFAPVDGESQTDALIRNIVRQVIDPSVDQKKISCSEKDLDDFIGSSPFVLLIDELNALSHCLNIEAGSFLRRLFLDKANRYLVFSTHVPMTLDQTFSNSFMAGSARGVKAVSLPISTDLELLQQMPGCEAINAATVALYGGIPSLIFSVKGLGEMTPTVRFDSIGLRKKLCEDRVDMKELLMHFVKAVVTGKQNEKLQLFFQFSTCAIHVDGLRMTWPICYIKCILDLFEETEVTRFIKDECGNLEVQARREFSGIDWECIINISLAFRCLHQQFFGSLSPFNMVDMEEKPLARVFKLPGTCVTVEASMSYVKDHLQPSSPSSLCLVLPSNATFPEFDGFVAYSPRNVHGTRTITFVGFQAKLGSGSPRLAFESRNDPISRRVVLRGHALERMSSQNGWEFWNKHQIQTDLLVISLNDLYPGSWKSAGGVEDGGGGGGGGGKTARGNQNADL